MKINKFILKDNADDNFSDLIIFEDYVDFEELRKVIIEKMESMPEEYTNEDIYEAIDSLGVGYDIIWLGDLEEICY